MSAADLADVLPTALTSGFGDKVCIFLSLLADKVLLSVDKRSFEIRYPDADREVGSVEDEMGNVDNEATEEEVRSQFI